MYCTNKLCKLYNYKKIYNILQDIHLAEFDQNLSTDLDQFTI